MKSLRFLSFTLGFCGVLMTAAITSAPAMMNETGDGFVPPAPAVAPKTATAWDDNQLLLLHRAKAEKMILLGLGFTTDVIDEIPDLKVVAVRGMAVNSLSKLGELKHLESLGLIRVEMDNLTGLPLIERLEFLSVAERTELSLEGIEKQTTLKFLQIEYVQSVTSLESLLKLPRLSSVAFFYSTVDKNSPVWEAFKKKGVKIRFPPC